jgi:hypothetical protein
MEEDKNGVSKEEMKATESRSKKKHKTLAERFREHKEEYNPTEVDWGQVEGNEEL